MALISTSTFTAGQSVRYAGTSLPNLRAAHTLMVRVKHGSTATNYDSIIAGYVQTTGTFGNGGTDFGRNNGLASTSINSYRINDVGTTSGVAANAGCYGNTSTWYHLAITYDATNIRFYVDGTLISTTASGTTAAPNSTSNSVWLGMHNGKFADLALFNAALTQTQIQSLCDYREPQYTTGLLLFWRLDSNANDSSGNGRNGSTSSSPSGSPTVSYSTSDNPPQPETPTVAITGGATSASTFAGALNTTKPVVGPLTSASTLAGTLGTSKPMVAAATSASTLAGALGTTKPMVASATSASSLAAWMRPRWGRRIGYAGGSPALERSITGIASTSPWSAMVWIRAVDLPTTSTQVSFTLTDGGVGDYFQLFVRNTSGTLRSRVLFHAGGADAINYSATTDTGWHHFALTFDGTSARAYVDATLVATAAASPAANPFTYATLDTQSATALAEFAHAKLWAGVALDVDQIASEANFFTPHVANANLRAWWQLSWQNPTLDSSGNSQTLTDNGSLEAQSESPGLPLTLVIGSSASASTLAGALAQAHALVGSSSSVSTLSAAPQALVAGGSTSASALAGTLGASVPLTGAATSASTLDGAVVQVYAVTGNAVSASTLSAAALAEIAGSSTSASTLAGALVTEKLLVGGAASASTLAGALVTEKPLVGEATSASTLAGALAQDVPLVGDAMSASTLAGTLGQDGVFAGSVMSASTLAGTLETTKPIVGDSASASTWAATLSVAKPLSGDVYSASTFSAQLMAELTGGATSASALAGELALPTPLAGDVATGSTLAGTLETTKPIVGDSASASTLAGQPVMQLAAGASSAGSFSGSLSVSNALVGTASSASYFGGTLTGGTPVSGGVGSTPLSRRMLGALGVRRRIR